MKVTSTAFSHEGSIPSVHTCDGNDISPELSFEDVPEDAKSLALIVDDPDAPGGTWVHWVVYDIRPTDRVAQDSVPGTQGANDFGKQSYGGPCPPSGTHRYFFKLYALDTELGAGAGMTKEELEQAMAGHTLAQAELIGTYSRS